jgi:hypothetical protein
VIAAATMAVAVATHPAHAGQAPSQPLQVLRVQANVYMLSGAGGNIAVQIGPDGVVLVDSGSGARTEDVLASTPDPTPTTSAATRSWPPPVRTYRPAMSARSPRPTMPRVRAPISTKRPSSAPKNC